MTSIALALALFLGAEANPVNVWTGAAPSGSCKGNRVVVTTTGIVYSCVTGTWAQKMEQAVATPTFSPVAGTYSGTTQTVTISDATGGSTIYYTTNGTDPTTSSSTYSTPISVTSGTTVKAVAALAGYATSSIGSATYTLNSPAKNAVLYASFATPGCYASGSTALAVNGAGTGVAMTFSRASVASYPANPTSGWVSCSSNQLRVSGWNGAVIEQAASNFLGTPTDYPTSSGNWAAQGGASVSVQSGLITWVDGSNNESRIVTAASSISGVSQTFSFPTSTTYSFVGYAFGATAPYCMALAIDSTPIAKFDTKSSQPPYIASGAFAGEEPAGLDWVRFWAFAAVTSGTHTVKYVYDQDCAAGTMAGTVQNALYFDLSHLAIYHPNNSTVSTYAAAGANRAADRPSFPVSLSNGNVCVKATVDPMNYSWNARGAFNLPIAGLYSSPTTFGSANSMSMFYGQTGYLGCSVYDSSAAVKTVNVSGAFDDRTHTFACCTSTAGLVTAGIDGGTTTLSTGAGTGILSSPPTIAYPGQIDSAVTYQPGGAGYSDFIVCNVSDPDQCGAWSVPSSTWDAVLGDSISQTNVPAVYTTPWSVGAATSLGAPYRIANYAMDGLTTAQGLKVWQNAAHQHRFKKVAVLLGTNDIWAFGLSAGQAFDGLKQIYNAIISEGAIPVPMTMTPGWTYTGPQEAERKSLNVSILNWCARYGYTCADSATFMDDGTYGGTANTMRTIWRASSAPHPNNTGEAALGGFMATYLQ